MFYTINTQAGVSKAMNALLSPEYTEWKTIHKAVKNWLRDTLVYLGQSHRYGSLHLVTPSFIQDLNATHRNKPTPTDILTFPVDLESQWAIWQSEQQWYLSDIYICPMVIWQYATQDKTEFARDLCRNIVHGVLHSMGLDHEHTALYPSTVFAKLEKTVLEVVFTQNFTEG
jgi:rRNA maturation RNase YbeY